MLCQSSRLRLSGVLARSIFFLFLSETSHGVFSGLTADLLVEAFRPGQNFNLPLGAHKSRLLFIISMVRATEYGLVGLCCSHSLFLKRSVVGLVEASRRHIELRGVPLLKGRDELLLDRVDLALTLCILLLRVLQLCELVAIDLL